LDFVRTRLAYEKLDGEIYWFPQNGFVATNSMSHVYLLSSYDEYLVGYKNRDIVLDPEHRAQVFSGNMFNPVIVAGGQVKGTWKRTLAKEKAIVTLKLLASLGRNPERALTRVVESYGHFLGVPAEMPGA
jgi:Winged helix DNA-binding domain